MNRTDLQRLARARIREAKILLNSAQHDGAYYLAGYAVECALKSAIARKTKRHDFPEKGRVLASYSHDLVSLVRTAELQHALDSEIAINPKFEVNWGVVKDWSESARYERMTKQQARDLYTAITARNSGVLRWLRQHW